MASRESVSLTFSADLAKLQSELAKIPGMTEKEAKLAVKELERQYKRAEVAAKKAADATAKAYTRQTSAAKKAADASALAADRIDDTSRSLDNMGRSADHMDAVTSKAGEASSIMGGLAGALDTVDPKLGAVARGLGDAAGGLEAVGRGAGLSVAALGPVAIAAAAAGAAYLYFANQLERAEKAAEASSAAATRAQRAFGGFSNAVTEVADELSELTGAVDPISAAYDEQVRAIERGADAAREAARARVAQLETERKNLLANNQVNEGTAAALQAITAQQQKQVAVIDGINAREAVAIEQAEDLRFAKEAEVEARQRAEGASKREAAAAAAAASNAKAAAAAAAAAAKEQAAADLAREQYGERVVAMMRRQNEEAEASESLAKIRSETITNQAARTGELADMIESVTIQYEAQRAALESRIDAAIERGADEVEAAEVYQERLAELEAERIETIKELEADLAEERAQQVAQQINDAMSVANAYTDLGRAATSAVVNDRMKQGAKLQAFLIANEDNLSKAQKKRIRQNLEKQQEAVTKAFRAQQSADIAGIAMSTSAAVMRVYATIGEPIAASAAAAGIVALGGVQAGVVASTSPPTFDLGGMVPMGTQAGSGRHVGAAVEAGEGVLTRQGVRAIGGEEAVAAANRGQSSGGSTSVNLMLRHRVLDVILTEHAGRGGTGSTRSTRTNPYRGIAR